MKVKHSGGYELKSGGRVDYYNVGNWSMELIDGQIEEEIRAAKKAIKAYKAWYKWLKKKRDA